MTNGTLRSTGLRARGGADDGLASSTERNVTRTGFFLFLSTILGLFAVLAYGWSQWSWMLAVTCSLISGACFAVGWVVGFLFGIPRSRADESPPPTPAPGAAAAASATPRASARSGLRTNTNLQDVSDWLTKLLLGAGLTQLNSIPGTLGRLGHNAAAALLGPATDPALHYPISVFVQALVVYFSAVGFLSGYLVTRLFLAGAFSDADKRLDELTELLATEKEKVETEKQKVEASEAQNDNLRLLADAPLAPGAARHAPPDQGEPPPGERLETFVHEYNTVREQPRGTNRTREMTRVFRQMMDVAKESPDFDVIRRLDDRDRGWRLAAYAATYANPRPEYLDPLVRSLIKYSARNRSEIDNRPFGEYWGIEALRRVLAVAQPTPEILEQLRDWASTIEKGTDRWAAMTRILQRYGIQI